MLISPPFLPARGTANEDQWLEQAMPLAPQGHGRFPVSLNLGWHGGVHLQAPADPGGGRLPVRAIADGTVVYVRQPTTQSQDVDHPLNYGDTSGSHLPLWTSDGCVVIRHETDIGADAQGQGTQVQFFSIYMHLQRIQDAVRSAQPIYRKQEIGQAGSIYGERDLLHLEIICDDANLRALVGRIEGELTTTANGRSDAVFGELYFYLPGNHSTMSRSPHEYAISLLAAQASARRQRRPVPTALQNPPAQDTPVSDVVVGIRYERGNALLTTYRMDGTVIGTQQEADYEYNLCHEATAIADMLGSTHPNTQQPSANMLYELFRFGRSLGPDALNPANTAHWRRIATSDTEAKWVNLNADGIYKFSDADFPHWRQWHLVDDSADRDSRCDSATIRGWLDTNGDGSLTPQEVNMRLQDANVQSRLVKTIAKFPTEWEEETLDARWGWLKTHTDEHPDELDEEAFAKFKAHAAALCFWSRATLDLPASHWHFEPREFIKHFRRCGWLSLRELAQLMPRRQGVAANALHTVNWAAATQRFDTYQSELNKTLRKYNILSAERQTHFLAQTYIETAMWTTMRELGRAHQQRRRDGTLYWPAPAMEYYTAFFGRGIMQLTWPANYEAYGTFRRFPSVAPSYRYGDPRITQTSVHYWADPRDRNGNIVQQPRVWGPRYEPDNIASNNHNACDSGGFYWVSKNIGQGNRNINQVADRGVTPEAVARASVLVNGGGFGFDERESYAAFIHRFRGDSTETTANTTITITHGGRPHVIYVDFTPQRP